MEDTKSERKGFGMTSSPEPAAKKKKQKKDRGKHPAWESFLEYNFPATKFEDPEYLTTGEVMQRLEEIAKGPYFMGSKIYQEDQLLEWLGESGFKQLTPAPAGLYLWMIKSTPRMMISEQSETKEISISEPEALKVAQVPK